MRYSLFCCLIVSLLYPFHMGMAAQREIIPESEPVYALKITSLKNRKRYFIGPNQEVVLRTGETKTKITGNLDRVTPEGIFVQSHFFPLESIQSIRKTDRSGENIAKIGGIMYLGGGVGYGISVFALLAGQVNNNILPVLIGSAILVNVGQVVGIIGLIKMLATWGKGYRKDKGKTLEVVVFE